jgi:hypothetical protein
MSPELARDARGAAAEWTRDFAALWSMQKNFLFAVDLCRKAVAGYWALVIDNLSLAIENPFPNCQ